MGVMKVLILPFLLFPLIYAADNCPTAKCGGNDFTIRFPFWLEREQPRNCGYPGFNLICNGQGMTVLNLPHSGDFFVRSINYGEQVIQIYDPSNCLPGRLLDFNLSDSPFMAAYYQNYTLLSCPSDHTISRFAAIDCLSNSTNKTLSTTSTRLAVSMTMCKVVVTLPVPVSWPNVYEDSFTSDLTDDLQLTWDVPNCEDCEARGGMCDFKNNTSREISCFYNPETGKGRGLQVFKIITLSIVIPAITASITIVCFICLVDARRQSGGITTTLQNSTTAAVTLQPTSLATGLEESTIESYAKVVLGESRRLPGPNDITCPICLSDYRAKETVRCIPECEHCFHADCIDEWLRLNGTCPVCRASPSLVHGDS
ncbi:unnamed protein product [Ilex paraguariensis]|uniref:RING-type domain-containing protein n=1 Tax=Ilex paraguariensis TaxID=185542 RepID=A0ABC8R6Y8_9AQUA